MKKIRLWKVALLSIVTLFYYHTYWFCVQRRPLMKESGLSIPSNWWLIGSTIVSTLGVAGALAFSFIFSDDLLLLLVVISLFTLVLMASVAVYIWWVISFLRTADVLLKNRVSLSWMLLHFFFISIDVVFILQYYFNRKANKKQKETSSRFIAFSIIEFVAFYLFFIALGTALVISSLIVTNPTTGNPEIIFENKELNELGAKTVLLEKKYNGCIEDLDATYPTITDENEQAYLDGYDACEEIRIEQNKAVDEYNELQQKLLLQ